MSATMESVVGEPTADRLAERERLLTAQAQRLATAAGAIGVDVDPGLGDARDRSIAALGPLAAAVSEERDDAHLWLLFAAMSGGFPGVGDMEAAIRMRDRMSRDEFFDWFIAASALPATWGGTAFSELSVVADRVLVDVNSCARSDRHTGIQRVERETLPLWSRDHGVELVAWTVRSGIYRELREAETERVLEWAGGGGGSSHLDERADEGLKLVVPWRTTLVLPEVADSRQSSRLEALARYSGTRVAMIGYDVIPLTSPELLPRETGRDFLDYLGVVRGASAIAGISRSATEEFAGYVDALGAEDGPELVTCELPAALPAAAPTEEAARTEAAVVLCVGSHEPRKNHGAVLHAAERLWREGADFELWFFGGHGWGTDFDELVDRAKKRGRRVRVERAVSDRILWEALRDARFTVFPSLHEGYGLPVAESLAFGTPVITTDYGSTREIAERGGCLLVDPRSDDELHDAMRRLLLDDEELGRLSAEASRIEVRTWEQYADELWRALVPDVA
ncbi:glycosyltransferase family 4 protein [Homoserinibacter sp. YIM 151385]|uniref:glycosyltransferase family 4 protein n=1 Tax=Homoserinibacter sp. YIM 151385 TaxID=2985506 RepID=UPI0022EFFB2D|nr:glycosyltransferase family 1 protein [Homoserinibacter sp. YIM 151385]WBU37776.1 glycosyltransferase family 1 protein [Homoserinibacter sp. YIM 151385]